jgi:hypothetical protein
VAGSKASDRALALCEAWRLARCKNISASYLCASASSAFPRYLHISAVRFICVHLRLRPAAGLDRDGQQAGDCASPSCEAWHLLQDPKRYRRLICVHRRHLRPRVICVYLRSVLSVCICGFNPLQVWIVAGSKPVTAPRRRAKPGAFCKMQKRYRRLICVHRRHLRPCVICVNLRSVLSAVHLRLRSAAGWIMAGSKPVTAPRRRSKLGPAARSKNAIYVSSVSIGVICVPALSAYICGPCYLRASAASTRCRFGS